MNNVSFDYSNSFVLEEQFGKYAQKVQDIHENLRSKTGIGYELMDWVDYPFTYDRQEFNKVKEAAQYINENAEVNVPNFDKFSLMLSGNLNKSYQKKMSN